MSFLHCLREVARAIVFFSMDYLLREVLVPGEVPRHQNNKEKDMVTKLQGKQARRDMPCRAFERNIAIHDISYILGMSENSVCNLRRKYNRNGGVLPPVRQPPGRPYSATRRAAIASSQVQIYFCQMRHCITVLFSLQGECQKIRSNAHLLKMIITPNHHHHKCL